MLVVSYILWFPPVWTILFEGKNYLVSKFPKGKLNLKKAIYHANRRGDKDKGYTAFLFIRYEVYYFYCQRLKSKAHSFDNICAFLFLYIITIVCPVQMVLVQYSWIISRIMTQNAHVWLWVS